jgi:hypothetical protein
MVWFAAVRAHATPLQPDVRRMAKLAAQPQPHFVPARAGWDGPEQPRNAAPDADPYAVVMAQRAARASLVAAAIPDWRAVFLFAAAILLLRWLRHSRSRTAAQAVVAAPNPAAPNEVVSYEEAQGRRAA